MTGCTGHWPPRSTGLTRPCRHLRALPSRHQKPPLQTRFSIRKGTAGKSEPGRHRPPRALVTLQHPPKALFQRPPGPHTHRAACSCPLLCPPPADLSPWSCPRARTRLLCPRPGSSSQHYRHWDEIIPCWGVGVWGQASWVA